MHQAPVRSRRIPAVLAAFAIVVASLVATAGPAAAAVCDNTTSDLAIGLNTEPGSTTTLRLVGGTLFLDGDLCDVATSITVFDFDPDASANKVVVIDATESWGTVFLNLFLEIEPAAPAEEVGATYDVRVLTGAGSETVTLTDNGSGSNFMVTNAGGALQLNGQVVNDPINWDFQLGGGDDTLDLDDERFINSLTVDGGAGDDTIVGTSGDDTLLGGEGDDDIQGMEGDDSIDGGDGDDDIQGMEGDDSINGGADDDTVAGGTGDDTIAGGAGVDTLNGNSGEDVIRGNGGDDILRGGGNDDTIRGGRGADNIRGNGGDDNLFGNGGADNIRGGGGDDAINGGKGQDDVAGNGGDDTFNTGDRASDMVNGGGGEDTCDPCSNSDNVRRVENR